MGTYEEAVSVWPRKATFKEEHVAPNPWPGPISTVFRAGDMCYIVSTFRNSLGREMARIDATGRKYRCWDDPLHVVPLEILEVDRPA